MVVLFKINSNEKDSDIVFGYGFFNPHPGLITQSGANALLKTTLDLQVAWDGSSGVLVPKLATELLGTTNGDMYPTKYFSSLIIGKGYKLNDIKVGSQLNHCYTHR